MARFFDGAILSLPGEVHCGWAIDGGLGGFSRGAIPNELHRDRREIA